MSSKAFYKSSVAPKLIHRLTVGSRSVEVWTTTCIVTNFGKSTAAACSVLINPSNPELSGVKNFPYFPRGGPVPKEKPATMHKDWQPLGFVSTWGGMEVGTGMLFPVSVVDGLVHQLGGWKLEAECSWKRMTNSDEPCPIGTAVRTSAGGEQLEYDSIIHTTPPFFLHDDHPQEKLRKCYVSATALAFQESSSLRVATPLLGSGARGFPYDVATDVASGASVAWASKASSTEQTLAFGLLEDSLAEQLAGSLEQSVSAQRL